MNKTRKCEHWLNTYKDWVAPRVQVQQSYVLWSGLYALSAALKRRVWIPRGNGLLGSWDCYPTLYVIFVAPPGYGKTTTLRFASDLFDDVPTLIPAPTACSVAVLAKKIAESPDNSLYIIAEEFGEFMSKFGLDGYEFLTGAFDGKKHMTIETISRGIEFSTSPCLVMAAGTTPKWIADKMPESVISGGFAARVIFVYEDTLRFKRLYYDDVNFDELEKYKNALSHDLNHIAINVTGEYDIEKPAKKFMEDWFQSHNPLKQHPKLQSYYQRKHVHAHKIALLWHISYSDDKILTRHDFEAALELLELTEKNLPKVFVGVGKNIHSLDLKTIYEYIKENGQVPKRQILDQFESVATEEGMGKLMKHLLATGRVRVENGCYVAT